MCRWIHFDTFVEASYLNILSSLVLTVMKNPFSGFPYFLRFFDEINSFFCSALSLGVGDN